ncbi:uncharacterized protein [Procambarus clarkii]|uniref:uncharacterized protein n=1 Tax=Procambarus clarkii TaxID=6728 RepID=UPI003742D156
MKLGGGNRRPDTGYKMEDEVLHETNREKDLGVDMTPNLSPEAHIKRRTTAAYASMANINIALKNLSKESFRTLFNTYVRPFLKYAAPAWSLFLVKHKMKLEKVQRYASRLVLKLRSMSYEKRLRKMRLTSWNTGELKET